MSRKQKSTILYSRNGIKIERIDYLDMTKWSNAQYANMCFKETVENTIENKGLVKGTPAWDEKIKHVSPLGFYYYTTIHHYEVKDQLIKENAYYVKYIASFGTTRYEFTYPTKYKGVSINKETRPWDILPGYKGMPDHFIQDLYKEINKMLNVWETEKIPFKIYDYSLTGHINNKYNLNNDMSWINNERKFIFLDIFGDENGPTINYNNIEILRHGFDLKESFRKRKEL